MKRGQEGYQGQGEGFRRTLRSEAIFEGSFSLFSCIPPQEAKYLYFTLFILQNIAPNSEASWKLWNLNFFVLPSSTKTQPHAFLFVTVCWSIFALCLYFSSQDSPFFFTDSFDLR
jgi:hypothetical protein